MRSDLAAERSRPLSLGTDTDSTGDTISETFRATHTIRSFPFSQRGVKETPFPPLFNK